MRKQRFILTEDNSDEKVMTKTVIRKQAEGQSLADFEKKFDFAIEVAETEMDPECAPDFIPDIESVAISSCYDANGLLTLVALIRYRNGHYATGSEE